MNIPGNWEEAGKSKDAAVLNREGKQGTKLSSSDTKLLFSNQRIPLNTLKSYRGTWRGRCRGVLDGC